MKSSFRRIPALEKLFLTWELLVMPFVNEPSLMEVYHHAVSPMKNGVEWIKNNYTYVRTTPSNERADARIITNRLGNYYILY